MAVEPSVYRPGDDSTDFEKLMIADIESSQEQQEQSDEVGATEISMLEYAKQAPQKSKKKEEEATLADMQKGEEEPGARARAGHGRN